MEPRLNKFNQLIWLSEWLDTDEKIKIPAYCKQLKIDVGLAGDAPNSAIWLSETPDRFVVAVEPLDYHWNSIWDYKNATRPKWRIVQRCDNAVVFEGRKIADIKDRFLPLRGAVNDVPEPTTQPFFVNKIGETGSSSLRPDPRTELLDKVIQVPVFSLKYVLDHIPWDRFDFIEQVKTDCEGFDWQVLKSMGNYIEKVVYVNSEITHYTPGERQEFFQWMVNKGFKLVGQNGYDSFFFNNRYTEQAKQLGLMCHVLGL